MTIPWLRLSIVGLVFMLAAPVLAGFQEGGDAYERGDYETAFKEWLPLTRKGDSAAQYNIGFLYHFNCHKIFSSDEFDCYAKVHKEEALRYEPEVRRHEEEALRWYFLAAENGDSDAQNLIGKAYELGRYGLPVRREEAVRWYKLAFEGYLSLAEKGKAKAQHAIGDMYRKGTGVPQDFAKAIHWYTLAADQGHAWAQYELGRLYFSVKGVKQDFVQAYKWLNLAAGDQGSRDRAKRIAQGRGVYL